MKNLSNEQHISRNEAATAAIRGVNIPIGPAKVFESCKSKRLGDAIDGTGCAFEFKEVARRCLVEVHVDAGQPKLGAIFLVAKPWPQTKGTEDRRPSARIVNDEFPLEPLLEARLAVTAIVGAGNRRGRLGGEDRAHRARPGRRSLDAEAQKPAARAKIRLRCVVKGVLLKNPAVRRAPEATETPQHRGSIRHPQFDLNLAVSGQPNAAASGLFLTRAHSTSISRRSVCPRTEESCQICAGASIIDSLPPPNARK
jgi:hypothetical protein